MWFTEPITMSTVCNHCPYDGDCGRCADEMDKHSQEWNNKETGAVNTPAS